MSGLFFAQNIYGKFMGYALDPDQSIPYTMSKSIEEVNMTDKEIVKTGLVIIFAVIYLVVPGMMTLEQCSTGTLFGRGCEMSDNYGEALSIVILAWFMINIVCMPLVFAVYFFVRSVIRIMFYK